MDLNLTVYAGLARAGCFLRINLERKALTEALVTEISAKLKNHPDAARLDGVLIDTTNMAGLDDPAWFLSLVVTVWLTLKQWDRGVRFAMVANEHVHDRLKSGRIEEAIPPVYPDIETAVQEVENWRRVYQNERRDTRYKTPGRLLT